MQTTMKLGPEQSGLDFPMPLSEKYRPRHIEDFAGLDEVKRVLAGLVRSPRPCGLLFVGAQGVGKSTIGMALAEDLPGTLCHISSQKCDVATLDQLSERFQYYPARGRWWVSLVDEADQMTEKAQLRCLSLLDSTSWLRPRFGGGFEQGTPPPVIWVFTCNGVGANQTGIPAAFEKRFLSRCIVLKFPPLGVEELAKHLHQVWLREMAERVFSNLPGLQNYEGLQPMPDFRAIAQECYGLSVRDALMKLEVLLLGA